MPIHKFIKKCENKFELGIYRVVSRVSVTLANSLKNEKLSIFSNNYFVLLYHCSRIMVFIKNVSLCHHWKTTHCTTKTMKQANPHCVYLPFLLQNRIMGKSEKPFFLIAPINYPRQT